MITNGEGQWSTIDREGRIELDPKERVTTSTPLPSVSRNRCSCPLGKGIKKRERGGEQRESMDARRVGESNTLLIHVSPFVSRNVGHTRSDLIVHPGGNSCGVGSRRRTNWFVIVPCLFDIRFHEFHHHPFFFDHSSIVWFLVRENRLGELIYRSSIEQRFDSASWFLLSKIFSRTSTILPTVNYTVLKFKQARTCFYVNYLKNNILKLNCPFEKQKYH